MPTPLKHGDTVRPNHRGINTDWTQYRGRVIGKSWRTSGTDGREVVEVRWPAGVPRQLARYYPVDDLDRA